MDSSGLVWIGQELIGFDKICKDLHTESMAVFLKMVCKTLLFRDVPMGFTSQVYIP